MKKAGKIIEIVLGCLIFMLTVGIYNPDYRYELTFISNVTVALVYITDGIISLCRKGKGLPAFVWHLVLSAHLPVFICVFLGFAAGGAFFFLHFLNPIYLFWIYLLCARPDITKKGTRLLCIFLSPVSFLSYALFDLIRFELTGKTVYNLVPADKINALNVILIAVFLYVSLIAMNAVLIGIRMLFIKKRNRKNAQLPIT